MRVFLSVLVLLAFAAPSYAADSMTEGKKPVLVKGSKSYQIRYSNTSAAGSSAAVSSVEPAAGVEMSPSKTESQQSAVPSATDEGYGKKVMKLHGKR